jgi:hypothetical protein
MTKEMVMIAGLGLLLGCAPSVTPTPSAALATPSADCLTAWRSYLATASGGILATPPDGPMRACHSLDEFIGGYVATYTGESSILGPERFAEALADSECDTGRFSGTLICQEIGITPRTTPGPLD